MMFQDPAQIINKKKKKKEKKEKNVKKKEEEYVCKVLQRNGLETLTTTIK